MVVNSCSTTLIIVLSMFLIILIIVCNFIVIFCKRPPCFIGNHENSHGIINHSIARVGGSYKSIDSINIRELSEISPVIKYSSITKNIDKNKYYSTTVLGSVSSNGTQKSRYCYSCVICLNGINGEDLVRSLPCSHIYHYNCIDEWVKIKSSCPLCNVSLDSIFKENILRYKHYATLY